MALALASAAYFSYTRITGAATTKAVIGTSDSARREKTTAKFNQAITT